MSAAINAEAPDRFGGQGALSKSKTMFVLRESYSATTRALSNPITNMLDNAGERHAAYQWRAFEQ